MKPTLLIISHVIPHNPSSGQQQRVLQMIKEAQKTFYVIFLTFGNPRKVEEIRRKMEELTDRCIVLPSIYDQKPASKAWFSFLAFLFSLRTGLKKSNYLIGQVELTRKRIEKALSGEKIDLVIYEYWHAWKSMGYFQSKKIPTLLDMHDTLSNAYQGQLEQKKWMPKPFKQSYLKRYRREEYSAWSAFDGIIGLNKLELGEINRNTHGISLFYCPMGIDTLHWGYTYNPSLPVRFGYYGGLGSSVNNRQALFTASEVMPEVWTEIPDAELWLVGSKPSQELQALADQDDRIKITGYLEDQRPTLSKLTALFCPWQGVFGFRSRIIEMMALGVPVIASPDAFAGMGLETDQGILPAHSPWDFAAIGRRLVKDPGFAENQSKLARLQVEKKFSIENTYEKLFKEILIWLEQKLKTC